MNSLREEDPISLTFINLDVHFSFIHLFLICVKLTKCSLKMGRGSTLFFISWVSFMSPQFFVFLGKCFSNTYSPIKF